MKSEVLQKADQNVNESVEGAKFHEKLCFFVLF